MTPTAGTSARRQFGFVGWFRPGEFERTERRLPDILKGGAGYLRTHLFFAEYMAPGGGKWFDWPLEMAGPIQGPNGDGISLAHVNHLGELGHAATLDRMRAASIVVSPSLHEPCGLVALEAARLGAALILSDIPTYRELWDGAVLFADPHDPHGFADAINRLVADPDLRAALSRRTRDVSRLFTLERQVDAMSGIYGDALSRSSVPVAAE